MSTRNEKVALAQFKTFDVDTGKAFCLSLPVSVVPSRAIASRVEVMAPAEISLTISMFTTTAFDTSTLGSKLIKSPTLNRDSPTAAAPIRLTSPPNISSGCW
ncbi:hypothetical protein SCP_0605940 [Sparassis crispa]|uniref:Uncharacterized protein n=1 Tax=Sparassis crispa TaxID=139825 RepID=A0A401GQX7_9APHY|nr:hypothetical protein SCP_0605940 [Sparassis crispa]GBE84615.1 hypothetical protein SCP_0605940 [Sparassis crispa]